MLKEDAPNLWNLAQYVSVRSAGAATTAFVLGILLGPAAIRMLARLKAGQVIRGVGKPEHVELKQLHAAQKVKEGTPTMGGILILALLAVSILLWGDLSSRLLWLAALTALFLGVLGFVDDYLKLSRRNYKGVPGRIKLLVEFLYAGAVGVYLYTHPIHAEYPTNLSLPFLKGILPDLGMFYIFFVAAVIVGSANATNLADGMDGLAIGTFSVAIGTFGVLAYVISRPDWCADLYLIHVTGSGELVVFCAALLGASIAFLWYNAHPARVFMGDTGSLALGSALGITAVLLKQEALLLLIGGIYVVEALSVIIQVGYFKITGNRVFRMSPIHHHFQMNGVPESRIVIRFWIVAIILGMLGLVSIKVR